jgi:peroxiredoxin
MLRLTFFVAIVVSSMVFPCTDAGEFNRVLSIGDLAPAWDKLEGVDGELHRYEDIADAAFVIVAFTCNSCPYAVDAEDRLVALSKKAIELGGVLVAINVNTIEEDALPAMREKASERHFDFAYLYDPTQKIAVDFGAKSTPEFYVLGPGRKVVYMGALDDSPDGTAVTKRHVETAIADLVEGRLPAISETVPIGCRIRFARTRGTQSQAKPE